MGNSTSLFALSLPLPRGLDLAFHPRALDGALREHQQQFVVPSNRFLDPILEFLADFQILRRKPAAHPLGLQVSIESIGELLVLGRIADEAGVELDGPPHQRADISDELVGNAAAAQKCLGNLAAGAVDGVNADSGRPRVDDGFKTFGPAQVDVSKEDSPSDRVSEVGPVEVRAGEVRLAQVRPPKIRPVEANSPEVRPAEVRPAEVRQAEVRLAEVRPPKIRLSLTKIRCALLRVSFPKANREAQ